jgi:excisionase family DNA binding protein
MVNFTLNALGVAPRDRWRRWERRPKSFGIKEVGAMARYLSLKQLSEECGNVSVPTLNKWIRELGMPHYRIGAKVLIKETEFDYWLRRMKRHATEESQNPVVEKLSNEIDKFLGAA